MRKAIRRPNRATTCWYRSRRRWRRRTCSCGPGKCCGRSLMALIADQREVVELTNDRQLHGLASEADVRIRARANVQSRVPIAAVRADDRDLPPCARGFVGQMLPRHWTAAVRRDAAHCRPCPRSFRWGCPRRWRAGGRISATPKRRCMPRPRKSACRSPRCFRDISLIGYLRAAQHEHADISSTGRAGSTPSDRASRFPFSMAVPWWPTCACRVRRKPRRH